MAYRQGAAIQETWVGHVGSGEEAFMLLEAARTGVLPRLQRRPTNMERIEYIRPGTIFVYEERESSIQRWTDQFMWGQSRGWAPFLLYNELISDSYANGAVDPLIRQTLTVTTFDNRCMHLVAYYTEGTVHNLPRVWEDARVCDVRVRPGTFREGRSGSQPSHVSPNGISGPVAGSKFAAAPQQSQHYEEFIPPNPFDYPTIEPVRHRPTLPPIRDMLLYSPDPYYVEDMGPKGRNSEDERMLEAFHSSRKGW